MKRLTILFLLVVGSVGLDWAALAFGYRAGIAQAACNPGNMLAVPMLVIGIAQLWAIGRIAWHWERESVHAAASVLALLTLLQLPLSCTVGKTHGEIVAWTRNARTRMTDTRPKYDRKPEGTPEPAIGAGDTRLRMYEQ